MRLKTFSLKLFIFVSALCGCNISSEISQPKTNDNSQSYDVETESKKNQDIEKSQQIIKKFFDLSLAKNFDEALKLSIFETSSTPQDDKNLLPKMPIEVRPKKSNSVEDASLFISTMHSGNDGISFDQELLEENKAIILAKILYHKTKNLNVESYIRFYLVKQNEDWRILEVDYDALKVKPLPKDKKSDFPNIAS